MLALVLALAAVAIVAAVAAGRLAWPDRWNPWAPLSIDAAPDTFFRFKLDRSSRDPQACIALLGQTGVSFSPRPDRETAPGCGFLNAVRIERTGAAVGPAFDLSCRAALSLALWERHALQPAAVRHFGERVTQWRHLGSYACRDVGGGEGGRRSRHATADAIDLAAFTLADGRRVAVARDWNDDGASGRFLHDVFGQACRFFDGALGPAYDAAHRDHFHFDRGPYRVCR